MQLKSSIHPLVLCFLFFVSCTKDELTKPVTAELLLEMETTRGGTDEEPIDVSGGRFIFTSIDFEGYRQEGEDYFFTKTYSDSLNVNFDRHSSGSILKFEMPQGVYSRMDLSMALPAGKDASATLDLIDRAALKGGVELWGTFLNNQGVTVPFLFVHTSADAFQFTASSATGQQEVVVKDKSRYQARLRFNPAHWLGVVNPRMLQSGKLSLVNGQPTIVISSSHNEAIYKLLVSRIEQSAQLLFE